MLCRGYSRERLEGQRANGLNVPKLSGPVAETLVALTLNLLARLAVVTRSPHLVLTVDTETPDLFLALVLPGSVLVGASHNFNRNLSLDLIFADQVGFEPTTNGLTIRYSAIELLVIGWVRFQSASPPLERFSRT